MLSFLAECLTDMLRKWWTIPLGTREVIKVLSLAWLFFWVSLIYWKSLTNINKKDSLCSDFFQRIALQKKSFKRVLSPISMLRWSISTSWKWIERLSSTHHHFSRLTERMLKVCQVYLVSLCSRCVHNYNLSDNRVGQPRGARSIPTDDQRLLSSVCLWPSKPNWHSHPGKSKRNRYDGFVLHF